MAVMPHTPQSRAKALKKLHERRRRWLLANGPCVRCQSRTNLEVHHRDPAQKVEHRVWSWEETRRAVELAKCEVLCRRCHTLIHSENTPIEHGIKGYRRGCRCDACRMAKSEQAAQYRKDHPERIKARATTWTSTHSYRDKFVLMHEDEAAR